MQTCIDHVLEVLNATEGVGFSWFLQLMSSSDSQAINFLLGGDAPWFGESLGVNSAIVVPRCCWINVKFMFSLIQVYHWYPFLGALPEAFIETSDQTFGMSAEACPLAGTLSAHWAQEMLGNQQGNCRSADLGIPKLRSRLVLGLHPSCTVHICPSPSIVSWCFLHFCCSILLRISNTTSSSSCSPTFFLISTFNFSLLMSNVAYDGP